MNSTDNDNSMLDGTPPRFLLNPLRIVRIGDPLYETAYTREELMKIQNETAQQ